jgi:hypothetical protein
LLCGLEALLKAPYEMADLEEGNITYILVKQLAAVIILCDGLAINKNLLFYLCKFYLPSLLVLLHCGINVTSVP